MALFLDVETTGFPTRDNLPWGTYYPYTNTEKYDNARIIQVSIMLCNDKFEKLQFKDFIVKPEGFVIENSDIHGITTEQALESGFTMKSGMSYIFPLIKKASHIFAHNSNFDMNVLLSELHRNNLTQYIDELKKKTVICTMKLTKMIVKIPNKYGDGIKDPSLVELYKAVMGKEMENHHNAIYDVSNLQEIVKKLYDTNKLKLNENIILGN
jgi:DNA polymerase III epsilon subunit-like protein